MIIFYIPNMSNISTVSLKLEYTNYLQYYTWWTRLRITLYLKTLHTWAIVLYWSFNFVLAEMCVNTGVCVLQSNCTIKQGRTPVPGFLKLFYKKCVCTYACIYLSICVPMHVCQYNPREEKFEAIKVYSLT